MLSHCLTALAGSHPDVTVRRTERMIISVDLAREWVLRSDEANARVVAATADRADVVVLLSEQQEPDERAEP